MYKCKTCGKTILYGNKHRVFDGEKFAECAGTYSIEINLNTPADPIWGKACQHPIPYIPLKMKDNK